MVRDRDLIKTLELLDPDTPGRLPLFFFSNYITFSFYCLE